MAIRWKLSILGLYKHDNTIFDRFQIPDGMDRQAVIDAICMDTAELSTIYTSPESLAHALATFSARRSPAWERAYNALTARYEILSTENLTEQETRTPDLMHAVNTTRTPDLTATGQNRGSDSSTEQVAGFNGNQLEDRSKTTTQLGTSNTVHTTGTEQIDSTDHETGTDTTVRNRSGYTRPAQDQIAAELALCAQTVTDMIVHEIKYNFCIMVY